MVKICILTIIVLFSALSSVALVQAELTPDNQAGRLDTMVLNGCIEKMPSRPVYHYSIDKSQMLLSIQEFITFETDNEDDAAKKSDYISAWEVTETIINHCHDCPKTFLGELYGWAAYIQYQLGDMDKAMGFYKRVLEQSPYLPLTKERGTIYAIAMILTQKERYHEALQYFEKWESLCPPEVPKGYFIQRSNLYLKTGDASSAKYYYKLQSSNR